MARSAITHAFEAWNVNKILQNEPARPDKMVFALIPAQDENAEIDRDEQIPPPEHIQHTADITRYGSINPNAVVYSVVLDTTVGDWEYNWIGLIDSATDTLLMVVHTHTQKKIRTQGGQQGNNLTRNLSMEFDGAAEATQITVTAETWQIDFSQRLAGVDERVRAENIDVYGVAAFRGDAFLIRQNGSRYEALPGLGYVAGLQCGSRQTLPVPSFSGATKVWVDASWQGTLTGPWHVVFTLRTATHLEDYEKDGFRHFVAAVAEIDASGTVKDLRPSFPLDRLEQQADGLEGRVDELEKQVDGLEERVDELEQQLRDSCPYRINDVLLTSSPEHPETSWPKTRWVDMSGEYNARTIMIGSEPLEKGGSDTVTLTEKEMPKHRHGLSSVKTKESGEHQHQYDKYQRDGTQNSTRMSVDNVRHGIEQELTSKAGGHSHELEGDTDYAGAGGSFSVVSAYLTLRGWRRVA
ncbi:phage tail protein [Enterobacter cloacae]|uniref:phage tail-collar fiber domain-containing protein n=1 Tax=Enterobacter cloacae TaxID=550 RepID=UPI00317CE4BF